MANRQYITFYERELFYKNKAAFCAYCGKEVFWKYPMEHSEKGTIDHFIPISKGVADLDMKNWRVCCRKCNILKSDWLPACELLQRRLKKFKKLRRKTGRLV